MKAKFNRKIMSIRTANIKPKKYKKKVAIVTQAII